MFKSTALPLLAGLLLLSVYPGYADEMKGTGEMNAQHEKESASMQIHQGHGVVNRINVSAGKVNISHEAIPTMSWPKMTMDFKVENKTDLAAIKPGMAVDFELTLQGKNYYISRIVQAK